MDGAPGRTRRTAAHGLWAAARIVVAGCGMFDFGRMPLSPGTRWQVTAVDDQAIVNNDLRLVVQQDGEHATLRGDCGSVLIEFVYDSDGRALNFLMVPGAHDMPGGCAEDDLMQESLVA